MPSLVIELVVTRRQRHEFLSLPWEIYRDDPNWVPPLRMDQKERVGFKRHPFYDDAEIQSFLARRNGKPVGRLAVLVNNAHNRRHKERRGFFGFFESIDDQDVASGMFDAAIEWLAARDIRQVRGPTNPSLNYECGLLVDGFHRPPFFMMTYNHAYYGRLIEEYGFQKVQDLYAFWGHSDMIDALDEKLVTITDAARERFHVELRPMRRERFTEEVTLFLDLYNQSLSGTWGFAPLSKGEIRHLAAGLKYLIEPRLALIAEVDGKPIGAVFGLLDYNPIIKAIDGRLFPFGFLKLLSGRKHLKNIRLISANVVPEYQRWGIGLVLLSGLVPLIHERGVEEVEFSWVLESNTLSRASLERGGAVRYKTYRLYDYES